MADTSSSIIGAHVKPNKKREADPRRKDRPSRPKKLRIQAEPLEVDNTPLKSSLAIDCRYMNDVPPTPVPKLLPAMPAPENFFSYKFTGLEQMHRPMLLSEDDIVTDVEIIDPYAYGLADGEQRRENQIDEADEPLLKDDDLGEEDIAMQMQKAKIHEPQMERREAIILRRHILLSNDISTEKLIFRTGNEAAEKKLFRESLPPPQASEIADRVEKTFASARKRPVHPYDKRIKAKRIMPVVPDFDLWNQTMQQVSFDEPPDVVSLEDLLYKTVPNARTTCFSYFSKKSEGNEGEYGMIRNYIWENHAQYRKTEAMGSEQLLLSFPEPDSGRNEVWFAPMPSKMQLSKSKAKRLDIDPPVQQLNVSYREPNAKELDDEKEKMAIVKEPGHTRPKKATSVDFVDGDWKIKDAGGVEINIHGKSGLPLALEGDDLMENPAERVAENPQDAGEGNTAEEQELFGPDDSD